MIWLAAVIFAIFALMGLVGMLLLLVFVLMLPVMGSYVVYRRFCPISGMRRATWYWRIWWWYGYHGLYQIDWQWKRFQGWRTGTQERCPNGRWSEVDGAWIGDQCDLGRFHLGQHRMVSTPFQQS